MKSKHLLFAAILLSATIFNLYSVSLAQCNTGWIQIAAGTYPSLSTTGNSYIAVGDTVNVTGLFTVSGSNQFCNGGTLNAGTFTKSGTTGITNSGAINVAGNITCEGTLTNSGKISGSGNFIHNGNYAITNNAGDSILITHNITMEGYTYNYGVLKSDSGIFIKNTNGYSFNNYNGGILRTYGDIVIPAAINNCGVMEIINSGRLVDSVTNSVTNSAGSSIIIRGSGLTSYIRGSLTNDGVIKTEGNLSHTNSGYTFLNSSTGYLRTCGDFTYAGTNTNSGTIEVLGNLFNNTPYTNTNNAGGTINVTHNLDFNAAFKNYGCITVGDTLFKRNSAYALTISGGGSIFTNNIIIDNGSIAGGANAGDAGYLIITGHSEVLNGVLLSGYLDICDSSSAGVAPYFDVESPSAYVWPVGNITDCGSSPAACTKAIFISCGDALPVVSPCSINTSIISASVAKEDISVFPNPAHSILTIELQKTGQDRTTFHILDITGREVLQQSAILTQGKKSEINISSLQQGIYFLQLNSGSRTMTKMFVKD